MTLSIRDLGVIDYQEAWDIQRACVDEVIADRIRSILLVCEHPPVLTLGRLSNPGYILFSDQELKSLGMRTICTDRGGEVTLHAPGQLILYPILNLENFGRDLHQYLNQLEQVGIDFLRLFGIVGKRLPGKTGVWVDGRKIMSIGIGVRKWVSFHGLGMNISTDLKLFETIRPCGLEAQMTSLAAETRAALSMADAKNKIINIFKKEFQFR